MEYGGGMLWDLMRSEPKVIKKISFHLAQVLVLGNLPPCSEEALVTWKGRVLSVPSTKHNQALTDSSICV